MQSFNWAQFIASTFSILLLLGAAWWWVKRNKTMGIQGNGERRIQLVEALPLSLKHKMVLIQIDNQMVLASVSPSEVKTLPVGVVTELVEGDVYHWGALMAGALFGSLPVALIYSFFVEYYVSGMTGSVKE